MTSDSFELLWQANQKDINKLKERVKRLESRADRAEIAGGVESLLYSNLPSAGQAGRLLFVSDGRKIGEGAGLGTGVLCYDDGVAWRRTSDDTTVTT